LIYLNMGASMIIIIVKEIFIFDFEFFMMVFTKDSFQFHLVIRQL